MFIFALSFSMGCFLIFAVFSSQGISDSLWNEESSSPYSMQKTFKEGDIITVLILESSSALQQAGTDTGVKDDLGLRFTHTLQGLYPTVGPRSEVGMRAENKYRGTGRTTRTSNIQATVAAVVTKILPNGNLAILGRHTIEVNKEKQEISVSGMIRGKDVSLSNTVYSYQVAEAKISVKGEGTVAEAETPGWFTRILNWLF
jgi:flagellar L-ring protein precursor FlgH